MAADRVHRGPEVLGAYVLPGGPSDPRPAIAQAAAADALGLGTVFLGERYATKDMPSIFGALSQTTERVRLAAGVTHIGTRHPMVLASMGQTLQALSHERFLLGFGRGSNGRWRSYGLPIPTGAMLADTADILRRLWDGERVSYDGPAGRYPDLALLERPDVTAPPMLLAGVGPRTLDVAGAAFDGAILHPLLTPGAVGRSADRVRAAAAAAGRDPGAVEIHATVVVAADTDPTLKVGARGLGYLLVAGLGEAIVATNAWDAGELARIRAHERFRGLAYNELKAIPVEELGAISAELPDGWLTDGTAVGTTVECAAKVQDYLDAGATHVLLHGSTPDGLGPLVDAFVAHGS